MCNKFSGVLVAGIMHLWRFTTHEVRIGWARIEGSILEIQPLFERSLGALFASSLQKIDLNPSIFIDIVLLGLRSSIPTDLSLLEPPYPHRSVHPILNQTQLVVLLAK
jgi:hypothetical protein